MKLNDKLSAAIAIYTGKTVTDIQVYRDPKVSGTYAIRATLAPKNKKKEPQVIDFLVVGQYVEGGLGKATPEVIAENLEESEFETWPPKSGPLKFF